MIPPIVGGIVFSLFALKGIQLTINHVFLMLLNGFLLACANAISNILNQVYDRDIDADHPKKRLRPIPSGLVSVDEAMSIVYILTVFTAGLSYAVFGFIYGLLMSTILVFAWLYSSPPLRLRNKLILSNLAIATPRGGLGILTAYSAFGNPFTMELLVPALAFAIYVFGANTFKDYDDMEADMKHGVESFPIVIGRTASTCLAILMSLGAYFILIAYDVNRSVYLLVGLPVFIIMVIMSVMDPELQGKGEMMWKLFYINYAIMMVSYVLSRVFE